MNDPIRWLEGREVTQSVRDALAAAGPIPSMPEAVHANLATHCATLVAQGVATHAAAGSAWAKLVVSSMASNTVKGIVFASLVGTAGTAGYYVFREPAGSSSREPARLHPLRAPQPREIHAPPANPMGTPPEQDVAPTVGSSRDAPRLSAPRKTKEEGKPGESPAVEPAPPGPAGVSVAAFDDPSIADEARLLESARAALVADPARALQLVQRHEQLHPLGQLGAEREFIAVEALLRLGRRHEAWQRAAPRLQQAPSSLYSKRLRELFGGDHP